MQTTNHIKICKLSISKINSVSPSIWPKNGCFPKEIRKTHAKSHPWKKKCYSVFYLTFDKKIENFLSWIKDGHFVNVTVFEVAWALKKELNYKIEFKDSWVQSLAMSKDFQPNVGNKSQQFIPSNKNISIIELHWCYCCVTFTEAKWGKITFFPEIKHFSSRCSLWLWHLAEDPQTGVQFQSRQIFDPWICLSNHLTWWLCRSHEQKNLIYLLKHKLITSENAIPKI